MGRAFGGACEFSNPAPPLGATGGETTGGAGNRVRGLDGEFHSGPRWATRGDNSPSPPPGQVGVGGQHLQGFFGPEPLAMQPRPTFHEVLVMWTTQAPFYFRDFRQFAYLSWVFSPPLPGSRLVVRIISGSDRSRGFLDT